MKKIFAFIIISIFLSGGLAIIENKPAFARKKTKVKEKQPVNLDGTTWTITVKSMAGIGIDRKDILIFKDKKFASEKFTSEEFIPTNYSLSLKDEEVTVFETMQTKDEKKVFWRGELRKEMLSGIISVHSSEGKTENYRFYGPRVEESPAETENKENISESTDQITAQQETAPEETVEKETPNTKEEKPKEKKKKKKKRWWRR